MSNFGNDLKKPQKYECVMKIFDVRNAFFPLNGNFWSEGEFYWNKIVFSFVKSMEREK